MDGFQRLAHPEGAFVGQFDPREPVVLSAVVSEFTRLLHDPVLGPPPVSDMAIDEDDALVIDVLNQLERELVGASITNLDDPVLQRLFPDAYLDDVDDRDDYRRFTRTQLRDYRLSAAAIMLTDLQAAENDGRVLVPAENVKAWLSTLTTLRLILSERRKINSAGPSSPEATLYYWLSWLEEALLDAIME